MELLQFDSMLEKQTNPMEALHSAIYDQMTILAGCISVKYHSKYKQEIPNTIKWSQLWNKSLKLTERE